MNINVNFQNLQMEIESITTVDEQIQLAAELGKTLLERNQELETALKEYQHTIQEQKQEIAYLKKHITALGDVNDSRLKVYEQLEVGIQDLERDNHRLLVENTADKKHIKTLDLNIETLEARCEDLAKQLEENSQSLAVERGKCERLTAEKNKAADTIESGYEINTTAFASPGSRHNANSIGINSVIGESLFELIIECGQDSKDEIIKLVSYLEATKRSFMAEQQRCRELEEQLVAIIQENKSLQNRISKISTTEEMTSIHDEISVLDEVRQGQMCSRCLRLMNDHLNVIDEQFILAPTEECEKDEECTLQNLKGSDGSAGKHYAGIDNNAADYSSMSIKVLPQHPGLSDLNILSNSSPYHDLLEKYQDLLELQRSSIECKTNHTGVEVGSNNGGGAISLAEELKPSGDFCQTQKFLFQSATNNDCNGSLNHVSKNQTKNRNKNPNCTPTEFSEAETTSSDYSNETSNKATQTDEQRVLKKSAKSKEEGNKLPLSDNIHLSGGVTQQHVPTAFLEAGTSSSGYSDEASNKATQTNEQRVLKKSAKSKEEGNKLPLSDNIHPSGGVTQQHVPTVTSANFSEDAQSVISSAVTEKSFVISECLTKLKKNQANKPPLALSTSQLQLPSGKQIVKNGRCLTPHKREPLDYSAMGVCDKKNNRRKNRNFSSERSELSLTLPTPSRIFIASGKERSDVRPYIESTITGQSELYNTPNYTEGSMIISNRSSRGRNSSNASQGVKVCSEPHKPSRVSQDLHKLKKLDLSYADVLRRADASKQHHHTQYQQQQPQIQRSCRH